MKNDPKTRDSVAISETIAEMMDCKCTEAFSIDILTDAMTRLPFNTTLCFDKIYGRWIFSNQDESFWPNGLPDYQCYGPDFTFVDHTPDMAIARGIHYYYHKKIKD